MEMLRSTIRTAFRSFRMMGRLPEENGGPSVVHLRFKMRFYYEIIWEDRRELSYIGEETSSFSVNLNNLRTVEDITPLVLQHLSNSECEEVLLFIDDITLVMSDMIYHVVGNRPSDLQPAEPLAISLSLDVTYHDEIESWEVAAMDTEDQLFLDHSRLVYEPVRRPASKASIDALERKKAEEQQEESLENVCVVCQDEVGRTGDFIAKLPCSHEFHEDCVLAWLERAHSCPLCRYQLPTD